MPVTSINCLESGCLLVVEVVFLRPGNGKPVPGTREPPGYWPPGYCPPGMPICAKTAASHTIRTKGRSEREGRLPFIVLNPEYIMETPLVYPFFHNCWPDGLQ